MITLNLAALTPDELEGLLYLFWDSEAVGNEAYRAIKNAYEALCGEDELSDVIKRVRQSRQH